MFDIKGEYNLATKEYVDKVKDSKQDKFATVTEDDTGITLSADRTITTTVPAGQGFRYLIGNVENPDSGLIFGEQEVDVYSSYGAIHIADGGLGIAAYDNTTGSQTAFGVLSDGQAMFFGSDEGHIPVIGIATPVSTANEKITEEDLPYQAANKQYVDTNLENKLDKVTTAGNTRLYSINADGTQGTIEYGYGTSQEGKIAQYGITGKLASNLTVSSDDGNVLTTKSYVDDSIATQVSSVYKAKGSITDISALPTPDKDHEGFVYNIENEFTTTDQFVEGAGKTYPSGTNVVIVNTTGTTYKYDVLAGMVDLSNYVTNDTLTTGLSGKLDKVTSTSTNPRLYMIDIAGSQGTVSYAQSATANTIVQRDANGRIKIAEPETDNEAATKKYVDDAIGNITALFASLVDMTKTTQSDEPTDDTEIVNDPTDNEEETVNA